MGILVEKGSEIHDVGWDRDYCLGLNIPGNELVRYIFSNVLKKKFLLT